MRVVVTDSMDAVEIWHSKDLIYVETGSHVMVKVDGMVLPLDKAISIMPPWVEYALSTVKKYINNGGNDIVIDVVVQQDTCKLKVTDLKDTALLKELTVQLSDFDPNPGPTLVYIISPRFTEIFRRDAYGKVSVWCQVAAKFIPHDSVNNADSALVTTGLTKYLPKLDPSVRRAMIVKTPSMLGSNVDMIYAYHKQGARHCGVYVQAVGRPMWVPGETWESLTANVSRNIPASKLPTRWIF